MSTERSTRRPLDYWAAGLAISAGLLFAGFIGALVAGDLVSAASSAFGSYVFGLASSLAAVLDWRE